MKIKRNLVIITLIIPFLAIAVSALIYPGYSLYWNALSDLGHATKSPSAPIFNLGLTVTSFLLTIQAIAYLWNIDRALSGSLLSIAFFLQLVAVYDEVYGIRFDGLHFIVSALFFIATIIFLILFAIKRKKLWAAILAAISIAVWAIHFTAKVPPGIAIPELLSVFLFIPAYVKLMLGE